MTNDVGSSALERLLGGLAGEGWAVADGLFSEEVLRGLRGGSRSSRGRARSPRRAWGAARSASGWRRCAGT